MLTWAYYRDKYYTRAAAVEAMGGDAANDPRVVFILAQIAVLEAALDKFMEEAGDE